VAADWRRTRAYLARGAARHPGRRQSPNGRRMGQHQLPRRTPAMSAEALELLIIAYGSRNTESIGDEHGGADQRRLEIALRPKLRGHDPARDLRVGQLVVCAPVPERPAQVRRFGS
jgi:hypothetical protein